VATRRLFHRGRICSAVLHDDTARSGRESQDQARDDGNKLLE
jgi:hypothetical protein